jgi:uncharacterized LabA/DUF88 family protein
MPNETSSVTRIAVFYDGTFFVNTSQYYKNQHDIRKHVDFGGLHEFIRSKVSEREQKDPSFCQIVEAHFFRGRFSLNAARNLESDRFFDQLLMYAGVVSHYYPMNEAKTPPEEKGIDVWLALEAYDLAVHKRFDVLVLFTGDQDYVPLIRKVHGIGTRVMLIGMEASWQYQGRPSSISTSQKLIDEASYPILLSSITDSKTAKNDRLINGIFER